MKKENCAPCIPQYLVLKDFILAGVGSYSVGDILETEDSVKGLISRGILRVYVEPEPCPCEPCCPPKECLEERLNCSPEYKTNKKPKTLEPEELDLPKIDTKLDKYLPAAALALSQIEADKKVKEAEKSIQPKRATKQVEVDIAMNNLIEEIEAPKKTSRAKKRKT